LEAAALFVVVGEVKAGKTALSTLFWARLFAK
jgi:hypothetical protein